MPSMRCTSGIFFELIGKRYAYQIQKDIRVSGDQYMPKFRIGTDDFKNYVTTGGILSINHHLSKRLSTVMM